MNDYGMFTRTGNVRVYTIIKLAKSKKWTWAQTVDALYELSKNPKYGEATDTAVREMVYCAAGFDQSDESFYSA